MFCNKCGKQIPDGSQFCQYCGNRASAAGQAGVSGGTYPFGQSGSQTAWLTLQERIKKYNTPFGLALKILVGVTAVAWFFVGLGKFEQIKNMLDWFGDGASVWGTIFYWLPPLAMFAAAAGILGPALKKNEYHISLGVVVIVISLAMRIGAWIFDGLSLDLGETFAWRIFDAYATLSGWSILLGAAITVLLYMKALEKE